MDALMFETYRNQRRTERYLHAIAPIVAADPLAHIERVMKGLRMRERYIPINDPHDADQFTGSYAELSRGF